MKFRLFTRRMLLAVCLLVFVTCKKEETEPTPRDYPRVSTMEVTEISASGASFHGEIFYPATSPITDHGFVWGLTASPTVENADIKSLGPKEGKGPFTAVISNSLIKGKEYTVRAYARTKAYIVYGPKVTFESQGSLAPKITGFAPTTALWGDTITISGENFSSLKENNTVKFGTTAAATISASENQLKVTVPQELSETTVKLQVSVAEQTGTSGGEFQLLSLSISSVFPSSGAAGTVVTIKGKNFGSAVKQKEVKFGDKPATITSATPTEITALVPHGIPEGILKISVTMFGKTTLAPEDFTILAPSITVISPAMATFDDILIISGTGFSNNPTENRVFFGSEPAQVEEASSSQLKVRVPNALAVKSSKIAVSVNGKTIPFDFTFSLLPPVISSVSPLRTSPGDIIEIHGKNFNPDLAHNKVEVEGVEAEIVYINPEQIKAFIPSSIAKSQVRIAVTVAGQTTLSTQNFIFPWISRTAIPGGERFGAFAFTIGDKGYVGGGAYRDCYPSCNSEDLWEFDPQKNQWTQKASFTGGNRRRGVSFAVGGRGYFGLGELANAGSTARDMWEYDPTVNRWTRKNDFGGEGRVHAVSFTINSKAYVGTGYSIISSDLKDFWEYDPSVDQWTRKADFAGGGRSEAIAFSIDNKGYLGTGLKADEAQKDFWEYNATTDSWNRKRDFAGDNRKGAASFVIGKKGYVGTGQTYSYGLRLARDMWEYNPSTNSWMQKDNFGGTPRMNAVAFSIGNKGYIGTGYAHTSHRNDNIEFKDDFWEFDPTK